MSNLRSAIVCIGGARKCGQKKRWNKIDNQRQGSRDTMVELIAARARCRGRDWAWSWRWGQVTIILLALATSSPAVLRKGEFII